MAQRPAQLVDWAELGGLLVCAEVERDLGRRQRVLREGPAVLRRKLVGLNVDRIGRRVVDALPHAYRVIAAVAELVELVRDPGLHFVNARVVPAPIEEADPYVQLFLGPELQRVGVRAQPDEATHVLDHRQAEARGMVDRLRRATQPVIVGLDGNQRIFRIRRVADRPVSVHGDTVRGEERRCRRVRDAGAATARLGKVDRITGGGRVEFGLGRQTVLFEPGSIPATDASDERLRRYRSRAVGDDLL